MNTRELRELLCAMIIGDGSLYKHNSGYSTYFTISHSVKQEDYLLWKSFLINNIFEKKQLKTKCSILYGSNKCKDKFYPVVRATFGSKLLTPLYTNIYSKGRKDISYLLTQMTTDLATAIWFFDDGSEDRSYTPSRKDKTIKHKRSPRYSLHTYGFSEGELNLSIEWFNTMYNLKPRKVFTKQGTRLHFNVDQSEQLFYVLKPYLNLKSMQHKFRWSIDKWSMCNAGNILNG